ncbi:MAG: hypothetical protein LUG90_21405 [Clostridiaceae bacterium]|nr:hypothetical protein [Clostridiaceae bacterium]
MKLKRAILRFRIAYCNAMLWGLHGLHKVINRILKNNPAYNETQRLQAENEYLWMRLEEIRDKVDEMEPPEGFPSVYNHAYYDVKKEVKRIVE